MKRAALATGIMLATSLAVGDVTFESFDTADIDDSGEISKDEFYGFVSDAGLFDV